MYQTRTFLGKTFYNYELFQIDIEDNLPIILSFSENEKINVVVVGAWRGDEIQSFLKWPKSKIWAFEPNPHNFDYLNKRYANNPRVTCLNFACGEKEGIAELYEANITGNDSLLEIKEDERIQLKKVHKVNVKRLDSVEALSNLPIHLLWIDAQGFELPILKGAVDLLKKTKSLFLEINEDDRTYSNATISGNLKQFLEQRNFYIAHQQDAVGEGSGSALFLNSSITTNLFDDVGVVEQRVEKSLSNREKTILLSNNFLYRWLSVLLPTSLKIKIKKLIKI